jgi:hypothetical protein
MADRRVENDVQAVPNRLASLMVMLGDGVDLEVNQAADGTGHSQAAII